MSGPEAWLYADPDRQLHVEDPTGRNLGISCGAAPPLRPAPPYEAGPEAAALGATAMIDVSDGLLADLGHVADASGVQIRLLSAGLRPGDRLLAAAGLISDRTSPVSRPAPPPAEVAQAWVLTGGEDHSLVATFPAGTRLTPRWLVIGEAGPGRGVVVDGRIRPRDPRGDQIASGR